MTKRPVVPVTAAGAGSGVLPKSRLRRYSSSGMGISLTYLGPQMRICDGAGTAYFEAMTTTIPHTHDLLDLTGRVAIVTGASQGIGAAIARRFGTAGARVVVHYRRDRQG